MLFILRKRKRRRQDYWALSRAKRLPSRSTFIAEEEMDLPFPSPPFASLDQPNPFSSHSSRRDSSAAGSISSGDGGGGGSSSGTPAHPRHPFSRSQSESSHAQAQARVSFTPPSSSLTPPRLLRARASESGSIFQESVWPPPSAASQLMDPLTYASQSVDLARIVTDVMGPPESGPLLLLPPDTSSREQRQEQEQEQGALEPGGEVERGVEWRGTMIPSSTVPLANPGNWSPGSELRSSSSPSPPSSPPQPLLLPRPRPGSESESESEAPLRPPSSLWLSRPLNPSPKGSPLQRTLPL